MHLKESKLLHHNFWYTVSGSQSIRYTLGLRHLNVTRQTIGPECVGGFAVNLR